MYHKTPYKPMTKYPARRASYTPMSKTPTRQNPIVEMVGMDKQWVKLLYLYYIAWKDSPNEPISIHNLKRDYWREIKECGFDKMYDGYLGIRSNLLYKYGVLSKMKATDGTNWNLFRINQKGLEVLEHRGIIPSGEKEYLIPLSEFAGHRVFQTIAPK